MATNPRRPPRGKVRPKTPVPTVHTPGDSATGTAKRHRMRRPPFWFVPTLGLLMAIGLGVFLGVRSARSDEPPIAQTTSTEAPTVQTSPTQPDATPRPAKALFEDSCASCHTLAAAGAAGGIGPNLDQERPTRERVLTMIEQGSLSGLMPAGLVQGDDAARLATYVAAVAGR